MEKEPNLRSNFTKNKNGIIIEPMKSEKKSDNQSAFKKGKQGSVKKRGTMPSILICDDDHGVRKQLYWELYEGFIVHQAEEPEQALKLLGKQVIDIALIDLHMPPEIDTPKAGLSLLTDICRDYPNTVPIIMTGDPEDKVTLEAIDKGAWDVFIKPVNPDELAFVLNRAVRLRSLMHENEVLKLDTYANNGSKIVGESEAIKKLHETIRQVAPTDATIFISGESGTGKELVAEAIYKLSNRKNKPFVAVNCAALTDSLIEDELFGHEAGAYTGSKGARKGKFELADKGTIFLDEVAELSPAAQAKLLRILQEGTFERLGSERVQTVDVRVIAATHQDLKKKVEAGEFREDLFYRLNVIPVYVPPLRERKRDIPLLANYFLTTMRQKMNRGPHSFSDDVLQVLSESDWKGNIRELRNLVERLVILVNSKTIQMSDLPAEYAGELQYSVDHTSVMTTGGINSTIAAMNYEDAVNEYRKQIIADALRRYKSKSQAATALGINRSYLYELIDKLNLQ